MRICIILSKVPRAGWKEIQGARDATTNGQHLRSSTMVRNVSISQFKYVQLCRYASCGRWSYPFLKWTHHDSIYFPLLHQGDHACLLSCCNCQLRSSHCYALVQRTFPSGAFCCTSFTSFPLNCSAENASRPSPASLHKTITLLCHSQAVPPCLAQPHSMAASLGVRVNCAHLMADPSTVATSMNTSSRKNQEELIRIAYKHVDSLTWVFMTSKSMTTLTEARYRRLHSCKGKVSHLHLRKETAVKIGQGARHCSSKAAIGCGESVSPKI